jgi:hypothetical protein
MEKLTTALDEISDELHHQYSLGYYPEKQNWDEIPENPDRYPGARLQSLCPQRLLPGHHQLNPAEDERPHQDLAEFGIGLHQSHHALAIQVNHLAALEGTRSKERAAAGEGAHLTRELPRTMDGDKGLSRPRGAHNLQFAGDNHKERYGTITLLDEHLARLYVTHAPVRGNPTDPCRR